MTRNEAIAQLRSVQIRQEADWRRSPSWIGVRYRRDAAALALAIRALEVLGDVAACQDSRPDREMDWVPMSRATWDAMREIAG